MAELAQFQSTFKTALESAPSFLVFDGFYVFTTGDNVYDPSTDAYGDSETSNVVAKFIQGQKVVQGENRITFLTGTSYFGSTEPSVNGTLAIKGESWNILGISRDPIGLTYTFTVENTNAI